MESVYFYCAVVGGTILVIQTVLLLIAGGDVDADADVDMDVDVDVDVDVGDTLDAADGVDVDHADGAHADAADGAADSFLIYLSFKTVVAFVTFFGLVGLSCVQGGVTTGWTLGAAIGAGLVSVYIVAWLMRALSQLKSEGNLDLRNAIGLQGQVYLQIPANNAGAGKVTVTVQGRKIVSKAMTAGEQIPTGSEVKIVGLKGDDTLDVAALVKD